MDESQRTLLRQAMRDAWDRWHGDMDEEDVPAISPAFEEGFNAAVEFLMPEKGAK